MASDIVLGFIAEAKHLIERIEEDVDDLLRNDLEGHLRVAVVHLRHAVGTQDPTHRNPHAPFMPEAELVAETEDEPDDGDGDGDGTGPEDGDPGANGGEADDDGTDPATSGQTEPETDPVPPATTPAKPVTEPAKKATGRRSAGARSGAAPAPTARRGRRSAS